MRSEDPWRAGTLVVASEDRGDVAGIAWGRPRHPASRVWSDGRDDRSWRERFRADGQAGLKSRAAGDRDANSALHMIAIVRLRSCERTRRDGQQMAAPSARLFAA